MSDKIRPRHLERKAILYVRQSSPQQVTHNRESQRLQYAMRARIGELGWKQIEVIDEDGGRSASGTVERSGFDRMVTEVCLGQVGAVAAGEVSRFARNSRDWHQLIEMCSLVEVDDWLGLHQLQRVLAQVEVAYSNSLIEAWWRSLKYGCLFGLGRRPLAAKWLLTVEEESVL
jgi:hypothetical protein